MMHALWQRWTAGARRLRQRQDWADFAGPDWADHIMQVQVTDRLHSKQGRSIGRWRLEARGRRLCVYLKRHYRLPWWRGLLALIWPQGNWSPGLQEWQHLEWARSAGFAVPRAVAAGEIIGPGCRLQSFLAVEELAGMLPLHEAIPLASRRLPPADFRRWKAGLARELARITRALHQRRRFHKDLYLCHFYIAETDIAAAPADWHGRVHLIDLHRLGHHPWTWPLWQIKDLAQLLYSSEVEGVDDRDRLRFWRSYRGRRGRGWQVWLILVKWRRYRRHNRRQKRLL